MAEQSNPGAAGRGAANVGYTRAAVERYLQDVARRRAELERAITDARGRTARAELAVTRLTALEHAVGASLVAAHAQQVAIARRRGQILAPSGPRAGGVVDLTTSDLASPDGARPAAADTEPDADGDLAQLARDLPAGFGDEFFGPLTAPVPNGKRPHAEAGRG